MISGSLACSTFRVRLALGLQAAVLLGLLLSLGGILPAGLGLVLAPAALLLGGMSFLSLARLSLALNKAAAVCAAVARGDYEARIVGVAEGGEVLTLLRSINNLIDRSDSFLREAVASMKAVSEHNYYRKILARGMLGNYALGSGIINAAISSMGNREAAFAELANQFEVTVQTKVDQVAKATSHIHGTANAMAQRSEASGGRSLEVGRAAQITKERSDAAAAGTRHLSEVVQEVSQQVDQSAAVAQHAVDTVNHTADRMAALVEAAKSIDDVVRLISDIAGQTNLLALNATIEAARAGEAGKGFAVVANEVKTLANQTKRATDDIARQVSAVQTSTDEMRHSISQVVETIQAMGGFTATVAGAVRQQDEQTQEIAGNIHEMASQATTVSQSVGHLSQASAQACAGTVRVIWSANSLSKTVGELAGEARQFLTSVRRISRKEA